MGPLLTVADAWRAAHPGAAVGLLALRGVANPPAHPALDRAKDELEADLRARFGPLAPAELRATPPLPAYAAYYTRFGQRYHVAMQLESVARKGKPLPRVAALVEAMFVAELKNLVLTAGHDLDALALPVRLDTGTGAEPFRTPAGVETAVKPGDMYLADTAGVLSAIVTGPADRARITPDTTAALFAAYAPPGVPPDAIERHLADIESLVRLLSPSATTVGRAVASADA